MQKFFGWGHFLIIFSKNDGSKRDPSQIISKMKNQFFHAHKTCAKFFDFCTQQECILTLLCQNFDLAAPYHLAKFLKMAAISSEFLIVSMVDPAPVSPAHWLV